MRPLDKLVYAYGFSWRKRALVRAFTQRQDVRFVSHGGYVAPGASLLLWGSTPQPTGLPQNVHIYRLEDGFLRSVGLGADLTRPLSWVVDDLGIYYDATSPSRLEMLLQSAAWPDEALDRAAQLRSWLVKAGLTKYNLSGSEWKPANGDKTVVLVAGQVETDASIAWGGLDTRTNMALLRKVRMLRPDSWVVYKPHPDVMAGLRQPGAHEERAAAWCDEIIMSGSMHQILERVHEVHVMTSLTGFEALLRGKVVFCHGHPFYAGWGLTVDSQPHPRRTKCLTLDGLVAGALLEYPVYVSQRTNGPVQAEEILMDLKLWQMKNGQSDAWWRRWIRPCLARP